MIVTAHSSLHCTAREFPNSKSTQSKLNFFLSALDAGEHSSASTLALANISRMNWYFLWYNSIVKFISKYKLSNAQIQHGTRIGINE